MYREILFRGKRLDNGEWVYGLPSYGVDGEVRKIEMLKESGNEYNTNFIEVDPITVEQYTNFDAGFAGHIKIFECDIVTLSNEKGNFVVTYDEDAAKFVITHGDLTIDLGSCFSYRIDHIGNIHDNPELVDM